LPFVQEPKTGSLFVSRPWPIDLRRRDKQHIMETVEEKTPAPRAHDFARARRDFDVDGMDNVAEGRDETVEPLIQRVGAYCPAGGNAFDCGLDFDDGGRREEKRVLMGLDPAPKTVRSPLARGQALAGQPECDNTPEERCVTTFFRRRPHPPSHVTTFPKNADTNGGAETTSHFRAARTPARSRAPSIATRRSPCCRRSGR
jgi:hypothetical protein